MPNLTPKTIYIGIDLAMDARKTSKSFTFVSLNQALRLQGIGEGNLEDVLAYVGSQAEAYIAIDAPRRPNLGLVQPEISPQETILPVESNEARNCRAAEYQLRQHHIHILSTADQKEACPTWMRAGFKLFAQLEKLGFSAFPAHTQPRCSLEISAHGVFCVLLEQAPFPRETLEGRLQRQLVLREQGVKIADPMNFFEEVTGHKLLHGILPLEEIHSPGELDALAGAYTAWMAANKPEEVTCLGVVEEGQIVLPVASLKEKY